MQRDDEKSPAKSRAAAFKSLDDEIGRKLQEALDAGELAAAQSWGKPLADIEGWVETPAALRMAYKILKDSGNIPADLELFHQRARLRASVDSCLDGDELTRLKIKLSELEQMIALRLEGLSRHANL